MNKPILTLFMLMTVDGKISTGDTDELDVDKDFPRIRGIKEGLQQYYDIEQTMGLYYLISGRVLAKVGANKPQNNFVKEPICFLIIDNKPHLNKTGVDNYIKRSKELYIITTNKNHPAFLRKDADNLKIIYYENEVDFVDLFRKLKQDYGIDRVTIQSGGTLNAIFLRKNLIDKISIIVAPALVGGKNTSTLIDGISLSSTHELKDVKALKLVEVVKLNDSYIHLKYDLINETFVD